MLSSIGLSSQVGLAEETGKVRPRNVAGVRRLYDHGNGANDRILTAVAGLSEEQFERKIVSSFSSVRDTLSHASRTEWVWLQRWIHDRSLKGDPFTMPLGELLTTVRIIRRTTAVSSWRCFASACGPFSWAGPSARSLVAC